MDYSVDLELPKSTPKTDPALVEIRLTKGTIVKVRIGFPDGCADFVHCVIVRGGSQVWPTNPDGNYHWNDYTFEIEAKYVLDDEPLTLKVEGWNDDEQNSHTISVGFNMLPLEVPILTGLIFAVPA